MRHGTLIEQRSGKLVHRPVFFFMRQLREIIVTHDELKNDWYPAHGSHVLGDQHNKRPDLLSPLGDRQDTRWETWRSK